MQTFLAIFLTIDLIIAVAIAIDPGNFLKPLTTSEQRIKSHGYPAESHFVETSDGYILNLFRIPYSHKLQNQNLKRPPILLQHGFLSNSDCWLASGPDNALAYLLADAGYDVWLGNARGNIYSRNNSRISINHPNFWRFDWHEIAVIDNAQTIDYIIEQTGEKSIHYAGHSQGTTIYFVLLSQRPEYNAKIKSGHMLAPCAFYGHSTAAIFEVAQPLIAKPNSIYTALLENTELLPHNKVINRLLDTTCGTKPALGQKVCKNLYLAIFGDGNQNANMSSIQVILETHTGGASSNQAIHFVQLYDQKDQFLQYDWGEHRNEKMYGQKSPPHYDLSKISAQTFLYSSESDAMCVPADVDILLQHLPHYEEHYKIPDPSFSHIDYIVAKKVKVLLNDRVIENLNKVENR